VGGGRGERKGGGKKGEFRQGKNFGEKKKPNLLILKRPTKTGSTKGRENDGGLPFPEGDTGPKAESKGKPTVEKRKRGEAMKGNTLEKKRGKEERIPTLQESIHGKRGGSKEKNFRGISPSKRIERHHNRGKKTAGGKALPKTVQQEKGVERHGNQEKKKVEGEGERLPSSKCLPRRGGKGRNPFRKRSRKKTGEKKEGQRGGKKKGNAPVFAKKKRVPHRSKERRQTPFGKASPMGKKRGDILRGGEKKKKNLCIIEKKAIPRQRLKRLHGVLARQGVKKGEKRDRVLLGKGGEEKKNAQTKKKNLKREERGDSLVLQGPGREESQGGREGGCGKRGKKKKKKAHPFRGTQETEKEETTERLEKGKKGAIRPSRTVKRKTKKGMGAKKRAGKGKPW